MITNKINGKRYVGQTRNSLKTRWAAHKSERSCCRWLKNAIQKYGADNFEIKILSRCDSLKEMNHREQYYISLFETLAPNGYNLTTGGEGRMVSDDTKALMSKAQKGKKMPPRTEEHKKRLRTLRLGIKQSQEEKDKRAKTLGRPIEVPELGIVFGSFRAVRDTLGVYPHNIRLVLNGTRQNWNGLTFKRASKIDVCEPSSEALVLLANFLKNKPKGNNGKKRTREMKEAMRIRKQIPIFVPELGKSFDSIKIAAKELGISTTTIHRAVELGKSSKGRTFVVINKVAK